MCWFHGVIDLAWEDEVVPDDWRRGMHLSVNKKGDITRCENHRGTSLIDIVAKILAVVFLRRVQAAQDSRTGPNQAGVRAGREYADQIFTRDAFVNSAMATNNRRPTALLTLPPRWIPSVVSPCCE
ncbi:unnamed protein product [Dibothriocephalus latus]|uniref:Uncharacterized protein n=1 Tax=Dibothriocephalus latus TaxID=60516 RepID=A0A3P7P2D6_DIBLA|nr:unnamed protein product [Dibothriocephalus latus]